VLLREAIPVIHIGRVQQAKVKKHSDYFVSRRLPTSRRLLKFGDGPTSLAARRQRLQQQASPLTAQKPVGNNISSYVFGRFRF
jgi:hypothetical protein